MVLVPCEAGRKYIMRVHVAAQEAQDLPATPSERRIGVPRFRSSWTRGSVIFAGDATPATTMFPDPGDVEWQWEHRTGFKSYDPRATARIEDAYQRGLSRVRLKAGKTDDTPMELFFHDMIQFDPKTGNCRKIQRIGKDSFWKKCLRKGNELARLIETGRTQRVVFAQYESKREELYKGMGRPDYNVCNYYKDKGVCATLAKSNTFFVLSMFVVVLNSIWIGVEADSETGLTSGQAPLGFQVIEHSFCAVFFLEIVVRFGAFQNKRNAFRDVWFCFDSLLVILMAGEIWILPLGLLFAGESGKTGNGHAVKELTVLRTVRLLRLTRLGRIARLLRAVPEVLTLLKGIATALRSVFFTLLLLLVLLFIFAVIFKTQAQQDFPELQDMFSTVPASMWLLLLSGTFLDSPSVPLNKVGETSSILAFLYLVFIFLSSFMVLNMLIGILCDVVHQVALNEKEEVAVSYLKSTLLEILECHDKDNDRQIHRDEFELLMKNPEMHFVLTRFGVNAADLVTLKDVLFEASDTNFWDADDAPTASSDNMPLRKLSFAEFLEVVLRLRGGNMATVHDIVDLREYVRQRFDRLTAGSGPLLRSLKTMKTRASLGDRQRTVTILDDVPETASEDRTEPQQPRSPTVLPTLLADGGNCEEPISFKLQLPKACLRNSSGAGFSVPSQNDTETLLAKLAEISARQQEMADRQIQWQQKMDEQQAQLMEQFQITQQQLVQVTQALQARDFNV